jgi:hypothetical protein
LEIKLDNGKFTKKTLYHNGKCVLCLENLEIHVILKFNEEHGEEVEIADGLFRRILSPRKIKELAEENLKNYKLEYYDIEDGEFSEIFSKGSLNKSVKFKFKVDSVPSSIVHEKWQYS